MARLSQQEFMDSLKKVLGDRSDDDALKFIEDAKDTISEDKEDWKGKYDELVKEKDELDKSWRQRYRDRFFNSDSSLDDDNKDTHENNNKTNPARKKDEFVDEDAAKLEQAEKVRFDDLFTKAD
jgi:hypothetical protein